MTKKTIGVLGGIAAGAYFLARNRGRREAMRDFFGHADRWTDMKRRSKRLPEWTGRWTPTSRALAGVAGGALTYYGLRRGGLLGSAMTATGVGMLGRGTTNRATRSVFGLRPAFDRLRHYAA